MFWHRTFGSAAHILEHEYEVWILSSPFFFFSFFKICEYLAPVMEMDQKIYDNFLKIDKIVKIWGMNSYW